MTVISITDSSMIFSYTKKGGVSMKVLYPIKNQVDIKVIKEAIKPYGGRCAKFVDGKLEYQIKEENQDAAYADLKGKAYIE
jgi:hypothetical protein